MAVPLSLPFALLTMIVLNEPLNVFALFGLFMLFGIVKKNGILQIDYTNTLRARGMERDEAILLANKVRLRPILMTTMMLVASMIPIAVGKGPGSAGRAAMAKVIIGGQMLCLLLTLLVTPVSYSIFDDWAGDDSGSAANGSQSARRNRTTYDALSGRRWRPGHRSCSGGGKSVELSSAERTFAQEKFFPATQWLHGFFTYSHNLSPVATCCSRCFDSVVPECC